MHKSSNERYFTLYYKKKLSIFKNSHYQHSNIPTIHTLYRYKKISLFSPRERLRRWALLKILSDFSFSSFFFTPIEEGGREGNFETRGSERKRSGKRHKREEVKREKRSGKKTVESKTYCPGICQEDCSLLQDDLI